MQEVSRRVVFHHTMAAAVVNFQFIVLTESQRSQNFYSVQWLTIWCFLHIRHLRYQITSRIKDLTVVGHLSTHFCVEWCFCKDEGSRTCLNRLHCCIIRYDSKEFSCQLFFFVVKGTLYGDSLQGFILHAH